MNNNTCAKCISAGLAICICGMIYMDARSGDIKMPDHYHTEINYNAFLSTSASTITAVSSGTSTTVTSSFNLSGS